MTKDTFSLPPLTLMIGAAASGKSAYAEQLVERSGRPKTYLATATSGDQEMQAKITRHQERRGDSWHVAEAPLDVAPVLRAAAPDQVLLFDCATLWLTNHLLADHDLDRESAALCAELKACAAPVVIVSNEVGAGIVPEHAISRTFRQAQGELNQRLATQADLVITVIAGLPLALKGDLP